MAVINDVIFTNDGKYLISASDDKTIRVWDIATGKTVRMIRGQIGKGHEGKIFAAALSPDNQLLAVGGYIGSYTGKIAREEEEACKIRIINFRTGKVIRLLKGHKNVINGLNFSPDNHLLISGSFDTTARIWDVNTGSCLHTLKGHSDHIYAVAFSPDSRMAVTGSDDHSLKLWQVSDGHLYATLEGHTDKVRSVAFTPDGQYILSGSWDKSIRLWDGKTGSFIKVLARQNYTVDSLSISNDGTMVVTGHGYGSGNMNNNVFSIPSGTRITQFDKHTNIVLATAISPDGATVATGGGDDQEIYLWDIKIASVKRKLQGKGKLVWSVGFSKEGHAIAWANTFSSRSLFGYGPLEKSFFISALATELMPGPDIVDDKDLVRAIENSGDISIRTQNDDAHPTLQILKQGHVVHEITRNAYDGYDHRSLTLTPDGNIAISGGMNGVLASYSTQTGRKQHDFIGHTFDVYGVAVSPDGQLLVSSAADQTVRLWKIATGELLMTLFYATDNEWVAWTEDGFYAASPNGEQYIGYHINRGYDQSADYVGIDQIGKLFYRPDLVAKKIQGDPDNDIAEQLAKIGNLDTIINDGLPPQITIVSQPKGTIQGNDYLLEIDIQDNGGGMGEIAYRINGSTRNLPSSMRDFAKGQVNINHRMRLHIPISLVDGENHIDLWIPNKAGTIQSKPASIMIKASDPLSKSPDLYVLAVGISEYYDSSFNLKYAHIDALELANQLAQRGKKLFKTIVVKTLINDQATTQNITKAFQTMAEKIQTNDVFVLFMAGHGKALNGQYHFLPYEVIFRNQDAFVKGCLSHVEIDNFLRSIKALKSLIILDTCHSGLLAKNVDTIQFAARSGNIEMKTAIDKLMRATGRSYLTSSNVEQFAIEGYQGHGVFTHALLEGLKGKADQEGRTDNVVTISELAEYVNDTVPKISHQQWGYRQIPMNNIKGRSFPIVTIRH
jgi:WD40 repeat protein